MLTHPYLNSANSTAKMDGFSLPSSSLGFFSLSPKNLMFSLIREKMLQTFYFSFSHKT